MSRYRFTTTTPAGDVIADQTVAQFVSPPIKDILDGYWFAHGHPRSITIIFEDGSATTWSKDVATDEHSG